MTQARGVLVGISGGIAAYKTAMLVSQLVQRSFEVTCVMTAHARAFVGRATFAALSGRPVVSELFDAARYPLGAHIELARQHQLYCLAPATANLLAKLAAGHADDVVTATYLSFRGDVLVAPAMNAEMWEKAAVQRNVKQLVEDGVTVISPESGWLSCRDTGAGRMAEPDTILAVIESRLGSVP
jgi:phosphopantothenoylcysteine decarboxylase